MAHYLYYMKVDATKKKKRLERDANEIRLRARAGASSSCVAFVLIRQLEPASDQTVPLSTNPERSPIAGRFDELDPIIGQESKTACPKLPV